MGDDPWALDITADDTKLVVGCEDSHEAWFIDTGDGLTHSLVLNSLADPRDVDILDQAGLAFMTGGQITGADPIYVLDIATESLLLILDAPGSNANVIAVQRQMHGDLTDATEAPARLVDLRAWPNPFNPETEISLTMKRGGFAELRIVDVEGRTQRRLAAGHLDSGEYRFSWDGFDDEGRTLASGLYFAVLMTEHGRESLKLVLLK